MMYFLFIVVICQTSLVLSCFDRSLEWKERHVEPLPSFLPPSRFEEGELIEARELSKPVTLDCTKRYLALAIAPLSTEERVCSTAVKIDYRFPQNTYLDLGLYSKVPTPGFSSRFEGAFPPKCLQEEVLTRSYGTYKYPSPADMYIHHDSKQMKYLVLNSFVTYSPFKDEYHDQFGTKCEILQATTETRCRARRKPRFPQHFKPLGYPVLPKFDATLEWQPREESHAVEARELKELTLDPTKLYLAAVLRPNPKGQKCFTTFQFNYRFPLHTALAYGFYSSGYRQEPNIQLRGLGSEKHPSEFPDHFSVRHDSSKLKYLVIKVMIKDLSFESKNYQNKAQKKTIYELLKATSTTVCN